MSTNVSARSTALELTPAITATEHTLVVGAQTLHYKKITQSDVLHCGPRTERSSSLSDTRGRRVDGTYENKPTNHKEQLKKSPQPTKETSAWHRPRKNNNRIKYQKSWCVTARLFHPLLGWYRGAINSHHASLTRTPYPDEDGCACTRTPHSTPHTQPSHRAPV